MWKPKFTLKMIEDYGRAAGLVLAADLVFLLIGRDVLGQAVIGLLFLVPVAYSAARWGQWPGICAAVVAFLTFNFFFIPPYYTFSVDLVQSVLLLFIFLVVAVVIVGRIQTGLARAQSREQEALLLYELSTNLIGLHQREAVAKALAAFLQQVFQVRQVQITVLAQNDIPGIMVSLPRADPAAGSPDRAVPIYSTARGLIGEILLWRAEDGPALPSAGQRMLQTLASLGSLALERAGTGGVTDSAAERAVATG